MKPVLLIIVILTVTLTLLIRAEFAEKRKLVYIFKPVSTLLVILIPVLALQQDVTGLYYIKAILAGLMVSLAGDIALMFRSQVWFRTGFFLFLTVHVIYSIAFLSLSGFKMPDLVPALLIAVAGVFIYVYLFPGLEGMQAPVFLYVLIISFMVTRAASIFMDKNILFTVGLLVTLGSVLFYVSDIILAVARFRNPFRYNRISLAFYYSGQLLIALSTLLVAEGSFG
jgi:uncharacterized membrane protein YhhN